MPSPGSNSILALLTFTSFRLILSHFISSNLFSAPSIHTATVQDGITKTPFFSTSWNGEDWTIATLVCITHGTRMKSYVSGAFKSRMLFMDFYGHQCCFLPHWPPWSLSSGEKALISTRSILDLRWCQGLRRFRFLVIAFNMKDWPLLHSGHSRIRLSFQEVPRGRDTWCYWVLLSAISGTVSIDKTVNLYSWPEVAQELCVIYIYALIQFNCSWIIIVKFNLVLAVVAALAISKKDGSVPVADPLTTLSVTSLMSRLQLITNGETFPSCFCSWLSPLDHLSDGCSSGVRWCSVSCKKMC